MDEETRGLAVCGVAILDITSAGFAAAALICTAIHPLTSWAVPNQIDEGILRSCVSGVGGVATAGLLVVRPLMRWAHHQVDRIGGPW